MPEPSTTPAVPSREQLDAILAQRQGELRDVPYRLLLLAIALHERSVLLTLTRNQLEKEIVFDAGAAVDCESNIATETLGRFLVSTGRLSEADYRETLAAAAARGATFEEVLVERQLLPPQDLVRAQQQNLGRKLLEPFAWTSGQWHLSHDVPAVDTSLRVRVPQLIVTGIAKVEPQESIDEAAAEFHGMRIVAGSAPLFRSDELRLSTEQQKLFDAIRRGATIDELVSASGSAPDDVHRFLHALLLLGIATTADATAPRVPFFELDLPPEPPRRKTGDVPLPAPVAPPERRPSVEAASADEVLALSMTHRRSDPFELLGVSESANAVEINRAFLRMATRFLPASFDESDGLREKAQEIFLAAARAYAELADPLRREALLAKRRGAASVPATAPFYPPGPVSAGAPEPKAAASAAPRPSPAVPPPAAPVAPRRRRVLIDPEELYREGRELAAAGKLREALSNFEMAADSDAQNGTYAAEVAWTRYQLLISPAGAALKALKNAIRIDPRCGPAYLYAGRVQKALGNEVEGQAYLDRAAKLMPGSGR